MAYPGNNPGATTYPGVVTPPGVGEADVPTLHAAPLGVPPQEALLVMFTAPTGKGSPITRECPADLQFGSIAPGGYNAMSCTLDWLDGYPPPDGLITAATAQVIDGRNGSVVWHGHVTDPGYTKTATGASHKVTAQGFYTVLDTTAGALAYVDRELAAWSDQKDFSGGSTQVVDGKALPANPSDWPTAARSLIEMDISKGTDLDASTPSHLTMQYLPEKYSSGNQDIISVSGTFDATNTADFRVKVRVVTQSGATTNTVMDRAYDNGPLDFHVTEATAGWTMTNARVAQLRWEYSGASDAKASRDYWLRWANLAVIFRRNDQAGNPVTDPTTYVRCYDLINDIIGRALRDDLSISDDVAQPGALVEQAAWWGGVTARGIFDFVANLEPDYFWAVWGPAIRGKARFEYTDWRQSPRYVIPPDVAIIQLAGGADDLANIAQVAFQGSNGVPASTSVSGAQQELDAAGVTRTLLIDLTGDGVMTEATARAKGIDILATSNLQRSSGTATLTGPVMDLREGRMVEPWEVRAGWMVVLADGHLRADGGHPYSLTGSRDGRSTFRLTETLYSASSGSVELTLDGGGRNLFNRVRRPLPKIKARLPRRPFLRKADA